MLINSIAETMYDTCKIVPSINYQNAYAKIYAPWNLDYKNLKKKEAKFGFKSNIYVPH